MRRRRIKGPRIQPSSSLFPRSQTGNLSTRRYGPGRKSTMTKRSTAGPAEGRPHHPGSSTQRTPDQALSCQGLRVLSYIGVTSAEHYVFTTDTA